MQPSIPWSSIVSVFVIENTASIHTLCHSLCHCCHSLPFVVTRCYSLSLVVTLIVIRCHSLYHSLSFAVTRCTICCHSLSLAVPLVVIRCHSLPLDVPLVCLFMNDLLIKTYWVNVVVDIETIYLNKGYLFLNKIYYLDKIYFCFAKIMISKLNLYKLNLATRFVKKI